MSTAKATKVDKEQFRTRKEGYIVEGWLVQKGSPLQTKAVLYDFVEDTPESLAKRLLRVSRAQYHRPLTGQREFIETSKRFGDHTESSGRKGGRTTARDANTLSTGDSTKYRFVYGGEPQPDKVGSAQPDGVDLNPVSTTPQGSSIAVCSGPATYDMMKPIPTPSNLPSVDWDDIVMEPCIPYTAPLTLQRYVAQPYNVAEKKENWILGINAELRKVKKFTEYVEWDAKGNAYIKRDGMTPLLIAILWTIQGVVMEKSNIIHRLAATKRVEALQFSIGIEAQAKLYKEYKPWLEANPYTEWLHTTKLKGLLGESTVDKTLYCAMGHHAHATWRWCPFAALHEKPQRKTKDQADITAWTLTYPSTTVAPRWHSWLQYGCRCTTSQQSLEVLFDCYLPTGKGSEGEIGQQVHTLSEGLILDREGYGFWNPHGNTDWLPLNDVDGIVVKPSGITMWNATERVCKENPIERTLTGNLELHRQKMAKIKRPSAAVRVIPTQQSLFKEWLYELAMHLPLKNISAKEKEDAAKEREGGLTQAVNTWREGEIRKGVLGEYSHNWTTLPLRDWRLSGERTSERRQPIKEWERKTEAPIEETLKVKYPQKVIVVKANEHIRLTHANGLASEWSVDNVSSYAATDNRCNAVTGMEPSVDGMSIADASDDMTTFLAMAQATVQDETKGANLKLILKNGNWVVRVRGAELTPQWGARGLWFLGKEKEKLISDIGGLIKVGRKDNHGRTFASGKLTWTKAHVHCVLMSRGKGLTTAERDCWILKAKLCALAKGSKKNPKATFARNFDSAAAVATEDAWGRSLVYTSADGWIPLREDEEGVAVYDDSEPSEDSDEVETEDDAPLYEEESEPVGLEATATEPKEEEKEVPEDGEELLDVAEADTE